MVSFCDTFQVSLVTSLSKRPRSVAMPRSTPEITLSILKWLYEPKNQSLSLMIRLLALVAAAHVEAGHSYARGLAEHRPDVGRRRHADKLVGLEVGADRGVLHIDHGRSTADRHRFLQRRDLHRGVDGDDLAE